MTAGESDVRLAGHRIADIVYEKLTGIKGIFSTRIAFVTKQGNRYRLNVADWDGQNVQTALNAGEPIISPAWSPDGKRLAYVSFETKKPVVYVHDLASGQRKAVAKFKGSNSAPAWPSPSPVTVAPRSTRSAPTAAKAPGVSPSPAASTPNRSTRLTASSSTSRPTVAVHRRSTACPATAELPPGSPSARPTTCRRASVRMASRWPMSPSATDAFSSP